MQRARRSELLCSFAASPKSPFSVHSVHGLRQEKQTHCRHGAPPKPIASYSSPAAKCPTTTTSRSKNRRPARAARDKTLQNLRLQHSQPGSWSEECCRLGCDAAKPWNVTWTGGVRRASVLPYRSTHPDAKPCWASMKRSGAYSSQAHARKVVFLANVSTRAVHISGSPSRYPRPTHARAFSPHIC